MIKSLPRHMSPMLPISSGFFICIYGFLLWGLYKSAASMLLDKWNGGDYSFAYLVPIVILYLAWEKRDQLIDTPVENAWWGIVPLLFGIALFWLGELGGEYYTLYVSGWFMLMGILWLYLGQQKMKTLAFPLFLILTTFPFPNFIYKKISFQLQLISSQVGVALLQIAGVTAHREGNVIDIGVTQLQVVEACNGLRYIFPLLVLGLISAYFFRASLWKRAFLVFSTIPLTIFWNSIRIALTGVLWIEWGPQVAEGFLHDFSGFVIFLVSMAVLVGEMWVLGRTGRDRSRGVGRSGTGFSALRPQPGEKGEKTDGGVEACAEKKNLSYQFQDISWRALLPRTMTAIVLLGTTLFFFQSIDFRQRIPIRESLNKFPLEFAEWRGARAYLEPEILGQLNLSDYTLIDYRNKAGQNINFYVAYFETQFKGGSIHSPETCLPGSGWVFKETALSSIPVKYGQSHLNVNRTVMEQAGAQMLVYFWFPQRGRILTTIYQLKLYNFWDALTQQRTDGALIRVLTPISRTESIDDAASRLDKFLSEAVPILDPFIPGHELQREADNLSPRQTATRYNQ
ncbi:MAG: VPLPA-CTERM-specific exosortase XrtD [Syntrophobacteraceae bacterium]